MNRCDQAGRLFGAYWDDEVTQAEREWLEAHLAGCPACRQQYEKLARTLETVGSLPRADVAADLPDRALAAARRATAVPDRIAAAPIRPVWIPVTAAAALLLLAASTLLPWIDEGWVERIIFDGPSRVTDIGQHQRTFRGWVDFLNAGEALPLLEFTLRGGIHRNRRLGLPPQRHRRGSLDHQSSRWHLRPQSHLRL